MARRTGTEERLVGLSWSTAFGTWEPTPSGEGLWGGREGVGAEQWRGKTMTWWNGDKKAGEKT